MTKAAEITLVDYGMANMLNVARAFRHCGAEIRVVESAAEAGAAVRPFAAETDIFITPGYRFKAVDLLMTNFHLPRSTLFMLVCAFAGTERMKAAYSHAVGTGYRFYSYGDCCLLRRSGAP